MSTISRQMAIEALERDEEYNVDIPDRADGVRDAIITISSLPSAQPERKKGEWIFATNFPDGKSCYVCKDCGAKLDSIHTNFCGECGADMRGEQK